MFGFIGNPFVTLLYFFEQIDIFIFGGTQRASDIRIIIYFAFSCCLIAGAYYTQIYYLVFLFAYLSCFNVFGTVGVKKPFVAASDRSEEKQIAERVYFADVKSPIASPGAGRNSTTVFIFKRSIEGACVLFITFTPHLFTLDHGILWAI